MATESLRIVGAEFPHLMKTLQEFGSAALNQYQDYLVYNDTQYNERPHWNKEQERHIMSGRLFNTADFLVEKDDEQFLVSFNLIKYWKNIEFGTKPHTPPYNAILNWVLTKPVIPRPYNSLRAAIKDSWTPEKLARVVVGAIQAHGTLGSHDIMATLELLKKEYTEKITQAVSDDMGRLLSITFEDFDKDRVDAVQL